MFFLTSPLIELAKEYYRKLDPTPPENGDLFFNTFGPGNVLQATVQPYERFSDYETLLNILHSEVPKKYLEIHKGTPFYFLAWTSFDLRNFEKALFYLDAAISEDVRKAPDTWLDQPASSFLTLTMPHTQVARRVIEQIRDLLERELNCFNRVSTLSPISLDLFLDRFVRFLLQDPSKRTIISAFYIFLLEAYERFRELSLRSVNGGSIEPFTVHLFKGGLIFESLLKHLYPVKDDGSQVRTLGDIFNSNSFKADFPGNIETSSYTLKDILDGLSDNSLYTTFSTTAKLRNTTGHNLVWDDVFQDPNDFLKLFIQELYALFYIVGSKFL